MIDQQQRPTKIDREAADWYARLNSNVIENPDLKRFEAWRKTPEHRDAYNRLSAMAGKLRDLRTDPGLDALADDAIARATERKRPTAGQRHRIAIGAGMMLAAGLVGAITLYGGNGQRYESAVGERKAIRLADGSEVILNTDSRISVRLTKGERRVTLTRGQALFEVAHDSARPFVVDAGEAQITAVGTRFDVYRRADAVQVTLTQGKVSVRDDANHGRSWMLAPGQKILVGPAARPLPADIGADTSWTTGQVILHDTPLAQAIAEVNRYSSRKVLLGDDAPADRRINGAFPTGDIDAFALAASDVLDLEMRTGHDGRTIELRARGPAAP